MTQSKTELNPATLYFKGDELASKVWQDKYAKKDKNGIAVETTPDDMHKRMAKEFARIAWKKLQNYQNNQNISKFGNELFKELSTKTEEELCTFIYNQFKDFKKIVPQGRVMAGLGVEDSYRSLSNCLRLPPPKDSYSSILFVDSLLVSAAKRGCGYGVGISNLRPAGVIVKNASNTSTGAVSFMNRYSFSTREVAQNGRRGACLIDIDIRHPEAEEFMKIKSDLNKVTGANVSVKYVDEFFDSLMADSDFIQRWPIESDISHIDASKLEYNKLTKIGDIYLKRKRASDLFEVTKKQARDFAEPGVFFWNTMVEYDPCSVYKEYKIDGTNACGEQPMEIFGTCRLIVLNLFSFILNPFSSNAALDKQSLYEAAYIQTFLGDCLVDLEVEYIDRIISKILSDPEPENEKQAELFLWENVRKVANNGRRIGCGITALGDAIAAHGYKYDSDQGLDLAKEIMKTKMEAELNATIDMSILLGPFNEWDPSLEFSEDKKGKNTFYTFLMDEFPELATKMMKFGRRNVNWSTISPSGTVSIMTQSTSGCEPLFLPFYTRRVKINANEPKNKTDFIDQSGDHWRNEIVLHPKLKIFASIHGFEDVSEQNVNEIYEKSPYFGSTANEINWKKRVEMQSILQRYTTSAISTTLNLPSDVTYNTVGNIYLESWKLGLKGQTIYRDGCRSGVLIKKEEPKKEGFPKRPKEVQCEVFHCTKKKVPYYVCVGIINEKPYEVFTGINLNQDGSLAIPKNIETGKIEKIKRGQYKLISGEFEMILTNGHSDDNADALTRLISASLRHGIEIEVIVNQIEKTQGDMQSFAKVIARVLKKYIQNGQKVYGTTCKDCGSSNIERQEGCITCKDCGWSKCS